MPKLKPVSLGMATRLVSVEVCGNDKLRFKFTVPGGDQTLYVAVEGDGTADTKASASFYIGQNFKLSLEPENPLTLTVEPENSDTGRSFYDRLTSDPEPIG